MDNTENVVDAVPDSLRRHWGWLLGLGTLLLVLGTIGLGMDIGLTLVSMYFFAALLIISGISHFIDAFKFKRWNTALWQILVSILYLIGAGIVLYDPFLASIIITAFLAWVLIVIGISRMFMVASLGDQKGKGWLLFAGITSVILGALILMQWPTSGLWVIGMFIAIDMIVSGWTYIFMALALRKQKV